MSARARRRSASWSAKRTGRARMRAALSRLTDAIFETNELYAQLPFRALKPGETLYTRPRCPGKRLLSSVL